MIWSSESARGDEGGFEVRHSLFNTVAISGIVSHTFQSPLSSHAVTTPAAGSGSSVLMSSNIAFTLFGREILLYIANLLDASYLLKVFSHAPRVTVTRRWDYTQSSLVFLVLS